MRVHRLIPAVWVGAALVLGAAQAQDAKDDQQKLQGTWQLVEHVQDGKPVPKEKVEGVKILIKGDIITMTPPGGGEERRFRFKLNPTTNPKAIDATDLNGIYMGEILPGIYRLDGDTLRWCLTSPEAKKRPSEFKSNEKSKTVLMTMKRSKK